MNVSIFHKMIFSNRKVFNRSHVPNLVNDNQRRKLASSSLLDVLAKKRTSMTMLRAGMFSTTVPLSFMVILVPIGGLTFSTISLSFLSIVCAGLMVVGAFSIMWSVKELKECSAKKKALCSLEPSLADLLQS